MKSLTLMRKTLAISLSLCLIMPGAAFGGGKSGKKNFSEGRKYAAMQQWDLAAQEFALAVAAEPENAEYRAHYVRALMQASLMFVKRGDVLAEQNDYASAYNAYRQSFAYDPSNELARVKMQRMLDLQKAAAGVGEATSYNPHTGNIVPTSSEVRVAYKPRTGDIQKKVEVRDLSLKSSVASMGKSLGLNVIFDETVRDARFSIDLQDVSFARALDLIFLQNKLSFELVDRRTIFVYPDNPTNRQKFERLMIKTFYLGNAKHSDIRQALQGFLGAAGGGRIITSIEQLNAVVVRATPAELQMVQELINGIDKNRAEVVVDISIYEISRTDALELGNQLSLTPQAVTETKFDNTGNPVHVTTGQSASLGNLGGIGRMGIAVLAGSTFTPFLPGVGTLFGLPPTGLSLLQSRGRSRLLYSSQVHALDGQQNQTKVGQSVPVRTGTNYGYGAPTVITPGQTGQTAQPGGSGFNSGLFDNITYKDVGLVIEVTPTITNEGYVEVKMKLESSSVEQSGDTANLTPTFSQRSLSTTARVLDGVTAVVGGVKQDTRGEARATLPFVGMIPVLGRFLSTPKESSRETDLVITVTPHIIRAAEINVEDHLAQVTGPMTGGLSRSLEEVLQAVKEDEEQERRLIAKQAAPPAQTAMPAVITAGVPVNTVSSAGVPASPSTNTVIPTQIQTVNNQQNDPRLTAGVRLQDANFAERQRAGEQPSEVPAANSVEKAADPAATTGAQQKGENATGEKASGDKPSKEEEDMSKYVIQPSQPAPPARVAAPELPDHIRERLDKFKAEEAKRAKEKKPVADPDIPAVAPDRGPQQPVARAVVKPAVRSSAQGPAIPIAITLKARTEKPHVGNIVLVDVNAKGQATVEGGKLTFGFNPAKMKVSSVLYGKDDASVDVNFDVTGEALNITFAGTEKKSVAEGGALLIIQFVMLEAGDADVELKVDQAQLTLSGNGSGRVTSQPMKMRIVK